MLVAVGGLHGNEDAGVQALGRTLEGLSGKEDRISGDFVAFSGNRRALARNRRYLFQDLNRMWTPEGVKRARERNGAGNGVAPAGSSEEEEQRDLLAVLDGVLEEKRGEAFFLDLHATSGPGAPFTTLVEAWLSRDLAQCAPVPLILGLGEMLVGTLVGYLTDRGIPSVVFEAGQKGSPGTVDSSEDAIWLALAGGGLISEWDFPQATRGRERLQAAAQGLPPVLEMRYRHPVHPQDHFRMLPGFYSFRPIAAGEVLALDRWGEIRAPEGGRLLLPLYQPQGEDGFFLIREIQG